MLQLNFTPFPELKTERLLLRQITMDDAEDIFFLRSDERVLKYIGKEPAASIEQAKAFIQSITDIVKANDGILWGITLLEEPARVIGTICYWNLQPENYRSEFGYALHPAYWRKGIMKEAIVKVLDYGFNTMKLHSVEARTSIDNIASGAVLQATGFVKEAHLKEEFFFQGEFFDTIIYSRLQ